MDLLERVRDAMTPKNAVGDRNISEMAPKVGIHGNTLRDIQRGNRVPSYRTIKKLAEYLGVEE